MASNDPLRTSRWARGRTHDEIWGDCESFKKGILHTDSIRKQDEKTRTRLNERAQKGGGTGGRRLSRKLRKF